MPKGRPPQLPFDTLRVNEYLVGDLNREHYIRTAASEWGKYHGVVLSVRRHPPEAPTHVRVYRLRRRAVR